MRKRRIWPVLMLLAVTAPVVAACGSDDDDGGGGQSSAAISSCRTLCDKQQAGGCSFFDTADECKEFCGVLSALSADCQNKSQASSECQNAQPDVCDDAALETACGPAMEAEANCQ